MKVTVSGSFHRHMHEIYRVVGDLDDAGVTVLSPADPRIVDSIGPFDFVASDKLRSIRLTQDRHLQSIRASDFLWVVAPDGYVGCSVAMEIGAAAVDDVPVFSADRIADPAMAVQVTVVSGIVEAMRTVRRMPPRPARPQGVLIDPGATLEGLQALVDRFGRQLLSASRDRGDPEVAAARASIVGSFHGLHDIPGCDDGQVADVADQSPGI